MKKTLMDMTPGALVRGDKDADMVYVLFGWSTEHGECYECGLPAAFRLANYEVEGNPNPWKRCAVCAANAACDGELIKRIQEED